jgi:hypothetical protein
MLIAPCNFGFRPGADQHRAVRVRAALVYIGGILLGWLYARAMTERLGRAGRRVGRRFR